MTIYKEILKSFPRGGISYVFAYGSGVKPQLGYTAANSQQTIIDLIFCVKDPLGWHAENMDRHPHHYSAMRHLGARFVMHYQDRFGAGVYFNTLVPLPDLNVTVKYGVVTHETLIDDLQNWRHLYLAGRLQKPVQNIVSPSDDAKLKEKLNKNLLSAMQVSLLLLPERFSAFDLFHTISSLSYKGDFRMIFGENKHKVRNIVQAQEADFLKLYEPAMQSLCDYLSADFKAKELGTGKQIIQFEQEKTQSVLQYHLRHVPEELRKRLIVNAAFRGSYIDIVEYLASVENLREIVQASVNDIVWRSSVTQSLKNIPSAGVLKSIVYSYRKALKTFSN